MALCEMRILTYLSDEFLVDSCIAVGTVKGLLEEGEENGYDNCGFEGFTKLDKVVQLADMF